MKKILHICLANFYIDKYSYQENILPKEHKNLGYDVEIIASTETFIDNKRLGYLEPSEYINEYGINVTRIPYSNFVPKSVVKKIRAYKGLDEKLESYSPDIIFVHDVQFFDAIKISNYALKNRNVKVYVDCHADFSNSARNFLSREILHKIFYKYCAHKLNKVTIKFWGVLPSRVKFLKEVYKLPESKVELLMMGAESKYMSLRSEHEILNKIKSKYKIDRNKFIIVTGGKIDKFKTETLLLIEVAKLFKDEIELIVFGSIDDDIKDKFNDLTSNSQNISYVGWLNVEETYSMLAIADLAIFPGRHSVLWEQCVAIGLPLVVKKWDSLDHLDIGGNIIWLNSGDFNEMKNAIALLLNKEEFLKFNQAAMNEKRQNFSYGKIAIDSIEHE